MWWMARVIFKYADGSEVSKSVAPTATRSYGDIVNDQRPIRIEISGRISPEFLHIYVMSVLHPRNRSLRYKGKELNLG